MAKTKDELKAELDALGVQYDPDATNKELEDLLAEHGAPEAAAPAPVESELEVAAAAHVSDPQDVGVPMIPSEGGERQGPEDALGEGPKRGDYRDRLGGTIHTQTRRNPETGEVETVYQNERADDIGDAPGLKGGVETDPAYAERA